MRCDAVPSKLGPSLGAANLCVTYSLLQHDAAIGSRINYCMGTSSAPHETCTRSPTLAVRQRCLVAELFPRAFEVLKGCSRYGASDWTVYASGGTPHTSSTLFQIQACRRDAPGPKTTLYCHCRPMTEVATLQPCQHVFRSRAPSGSRHGRQCKAVCAASTKPSKYHISMCTNKTCKKQGCQQVTWVIQFLALHHQVWQVGKHYKLFGLPYLCRSFSLLRT